MKKLVEKRKKVLTKVLACGDFVRGSISSVCSTCNRAHCTCTPRSSKRAYRLTYKDAQQKTKTVYVPESRLPEIRRLLAHHAQLRKLIDQLMTINVEIFKQSAQNQ